MVSLVSSCVSFCSQFCDVHVLPLCIVWFLCGRASVNKNSSFAAVVLTRLGALHRSLVGYWCVGYWRVLYCGVVLWWCCRRLLLSLVFRGGAGSLLCWLLVHLGNVFCTSSVSVADLSFATSPSPFTWASRRYQGDHCLCILPP
jgi:hypothetical protein